MQRYDFYKPISYTEEQAKNIRFIVSRILESVKPVSSLVGNKGAFLKSLKQIAIDDQRAHYLSFNLFQTVGSRFISIRTQDT